MPTVTRFEELDAWKFAREITKDVYRVSRLEPFCRDYSLRDQICSASVSVMSNIAEGFERSGTREFVNFLSIAKGSCGEVRSQLYVALDQNYINVSDFDAIYQKADRNGRIINGLMTYLNHSNMPGRKFNKGSGR